MAIQWFIVFAFLYAALEKASSQITAPTENEQQCFNGIMKGNCSQSDRRIFVKELIAGTKYASLYPGTCPYTHQLGVAPECCVKGADDCYGEYIPVDIDPYLFHKDCTGKNKCTEKPAVRMDSPYLNCNQSIYPAVTTYFEMVFYCIDVNNIGELSNANKQNDGQGSTLYLWSGTTTDYEVLPATTYTCSVETDCEGTITVSSLDFRFSENDFNLTCIDDNVLTITDGSNSQEFSCATSNNNFEVQQLYSSSNSYITLTYTGNTAGGHLWLAFQASTNGNLSINCLSPSPINTCVSTTTTTEETTTTEVMTTTSTAATTTTTEVTTTTTEEATTTTTDLSTTTSTENLTTTTAMLTTSGENRVVMESASKNNNTLIIIIAVVVVLVILAVTIGIIIYFTKFRRKKIKRKKDEENPIVSDEHQSTAGQMTHENRTASNGTLTTITTKDIKSEFIPPIGHIDEKNHSSKKRKKKKKKKMKLESKENLEHFVDGKEKENTVTQENTFPNGDHVRNTGTIDAENQNKGEKKKKKKKKRKRNQVEASDDDLSIEPSGQFGQPPESHSIEDEQTRERKKKKRKVNSESENPVIHENNTNLEEKNEKRKKKKKKRKREMEENN